MPMFKQLNKKWHSTHVITQITRHNLNQQYIVLFTPSIHSTTQSIWLRLVVYMFSYVCVCVLCMHFAKHWGEMGIRLTPICRKRHGGSKHGLSLSKYRQKLQWEREGERHGGGEGNWQEGDREVERVKKQTGRKAKGPPYTDNNSDHCMLHCLRFSNKVLVAISKL